MFTYFYTTGKKMPDLVDTIKSYNKQVYVLERKILMRVSKVGWDDNLLSTEMQKVNELEMHIDVLLQQLHAKREYLPPAYSCINYEIQPPCYDSFEHD